MKNKIIIEEFGKLSDKLNSPTGVRLQIYNLSSWFSLNMTIFMQYIGINKNIKNKFKSKKNILNIGSGDEFPNLCVNTDLFPGFGNIFRILSGKIKKEYQCYLNVVYKDKYLKESANGIIFSHVLEHIPPFLTIEVLKNLRYYLKENGVLRISVPDIRKYNLDEIPTDQNFITPIIAKNSLIYRWGHQCMYDEELLIALLDESGFKDIQIVSFNNGLLGELDIDRRKYETLYITAIK